MEKIVDDLKSIKETIFNNFFDQSNNANNSAFNKLIVLQNLDDDLKETLILLHSNYITELEVIKKVNYKALDQLVTNNLEAYRFIFEKDDQLAKLVDSMSKKQPRLSTSRVVTFVLVVFSFSFFFGFMWYLFKTDKESGHMVIELIKLLLDKINPIDVNAMVNPASAINPPSN